MIISHRHKFIFIKLRKTAGTSLEIALSGICGDHDVITSISDADERVRQALGYPGPRNTVIPFRHYRPAHWKDLIMNGRRRHYYNHMPATLIKPTLPKNIWDEYFKFCFERNPWDKVISHYYHRNRSNKYDGIMDYLLHDKGDGIMGMEAYTINGQVAVDRIFRYEELDAALKELSTVLNLSDELKMPDYRAKSQFRKDHRSYREILTEEEAALIAKMFEADIALLGYKY